MKLPEWYKRIQTPYPQEKIDWEKDNFSMIVSGEIEYNWEEGLRKTTYKLKDKTIKVFISPL